MDKFFFAFEVQGFLMLYYFRENGWKGKNMDRLFSKDCEIGYIGFDKTEDIEASLKNHQLFYERKVNIHEEKDLLVLLKKLKEKQYDYILVPSRNQENEINDLFLTLISRIDIEGINEIGMILGKMTYQTKSVLKDTSLEMQKNALGNFKNKEKICSYKISEKEEENNQEIPMEYRIFKRNEYETSKFTKFGIWLLKNNRLKHILEFLSGFVVFAMLVFLIFRLIPSINEQLEKISILVELIATVIIVLLQLILRIADTEEAIKRKMIVGYWVYYSFEETDSNGKTVPKGFKTRLVEISDKGGNLSFKCKFEGEDEIFFATDTLTFDYDISSQMGRGFYYYTSNVINNNGKRAEGTCRFEGETIQNNQIMTMNGWFFSRGTALTGKVKYFRISERDYLDLQLSLSFYESNISHDDKIRIGVFGMEASNTDMAAKDEEILEKIKEDSKRKKDSYEYVYYESIDDLKSALISRQMDYVIVPLKNRDNIIKEHDIFDSRRFEEVYEKNFEIEYYLGVKDENLPIDENTIFYGHSQSLLQCEEFLKHHKTIKESSSSRAAYNLCNGYYPNNAVVLCNFEAIKKYHLFFLKKDGKRLDPYLSSLPNITTFCVYTLKRDE